MKGQNEAPMRRYAAFSPPASKPWANQSRRVKRIE